MGNGNPASKHGVLHVVLFGASKSDSQGKATPREVDQLSPAIGLGSLDIFRLHLFGTFVGIFHETLQKVNNFSQGRQQPRSDRGNPKAPSSS